MTVSPVSGRLDAFEWKAPFGQLEGPVEDVSVDNALASLPDVAQPEIRERIIEIPVPVKAEPTPHIETKVEPKVETRTPVKPVIETPKPKVQPSQQPQPASALKAEEVVPFFGGAPDDPGVKKAEGAHLAEPAMPMVQTTPVSKPSAQKTTAAEKGDEPVPFYGGLPDDPGVKKTAATTDEKTRLNLF